MDTIINSLKSRFEKNHPLLQAFSLFAPSRFPQLVKNFKTAHDLQACLNTFCKMHNIDAFRCADELFNFARSFEKFDCLSVCQQEDDDDSGEDDDYDDDMMMTIMMLMTTRITVMVMVMVMMIVIMKLTRTTMTKSQARQITSRATMVPRKLKNNRRKKFHPSLTLFYSFVTRIIVWLMRIQLSVVFMLLLSPFQ